MFRRTWSGLPKDVAFTPDLKILGYFVNEKDEIRNIENPNHYFKFFLTKNDRVNQRQRFAFNQAVEGIIHERLEGLGMKKEYLPLDATEGPRMPIFTSENIHEASRVVVIFGETSQDLGILAQRIIGGKGGINEGSMVSVVRALQKQPRSANNTKPPGIILANMGQMYYWPEGQRCLTVNASSAVPLPSLVHSGRKHVPAENEVPMNENPVKHVEYMLKTALQELITLGTNVDVLALGDSCEIVQKALDRTDIWDAWKGMLHSMILFDGTCTTDVLQNAAFKKFLADQARSYARAVEPLGTPLAGPQGNMARNMMPTGTPVYSSSEMHYTELALIKCLHHALTYLEDRALDPGATNPIMDILEIPPEGEDAQAWAADYKDAKQNIGISVVAPEEMERQRKEMRQWRKFAEGGIAAYDDEDSDEALETEEVIATGDASKMDTW